MSESLKPADAGRDADSARSTYKSRSPFWLMPFLLLLYFAVATLLFFFWVEPSLVGESERQIAADSPKYLYFADSLRKGEIDPYVVSALYSFPNTNWGPTLVAFLIPDMYSMMILNFALFCVSLWLFGKAVDTNLALFLLLLALNPTTTISLLAVNKEILDLLSVALFVYCLRYHSRFLLLLALVISLVSRFETGATMMIFLLFRSRLNPWRKSRWSSLFVYCIVLNVAIAMILALPSQASRLTEAAGAAGEAVQSSGILLMLNGLETHFLFVVALVPKLLDNLFAEVFNVSHWFAFDANDPANTSILFGNNLANLVVVVYLAAKKRLSLRSSIIYYAVLIAVTMSVSVVIQPRYFYGMYALLCLEAARRIQQTQTTSSERNQDVAA